MSENKRISSDADTFQESNLPLDSARSTVVKQEYLRHRLKAGQPERTYLAVTFKIKATGKSYTQYLGLGGNDKEGDNFMPAGDGAYLVAAPGKDAKPINKKSKGGRYLATLQAQASPEFRAALNNDVRAVVPFDIFTTLNKENGGTDSTGKAIMIEYTTVTEFYGSNGHAASMESDAAFQGKVGEAILAVLKAKGGKVPINSLPGALFGGTWFQSAPEKAQASSLATNAEFLNGLAGAKLEGTFLTVVQ